MSMVTEQSLPIPHTDSGHNSSYSVKGVLTLSLAKMTVCVTMSFGVSREATLLSVDRW